MSSFGLGRGLCVFSGLRDACCSSSVSVSVVDLELSKWVHNIYIRKLTTHAHQRDVKLLYTAGAGLLTATENGCEIHWSLFKFPNHLYRVTIVYELIISTVRILLYYLKYKINFLNVKSYCFPLTLWDQDRGNLQQKAYEFENNNV